MVELSPMSCQSHLPAIKDKLDVTQEGPMLSIALGTNRPRENGRQIRFLLIMDQVYKVQQTVDINKLILRQVREKKAALSLRT